MKYIRRLMTIGITCCALALAGPAAAQAATATIGQSGTDMVYKGAVSEVDDVTVTAKSPSGWIFERGGTAGAEGLTAETNCVVAVAETKIECAGTTTVTFNLGGGDDRVLGGADAHPMAFNGGAGEDFIGVAGSATNAVDGGEGNDLIQVSKATGTNAIEAGEGDDVVEFPVGADDVHGGTGTDTVVYSSAAPVSVTLDDVTNDGAAGGPMSDIRADVENLTGGAEEDTFVGSDADNVLSGGSGQDVLEGGKGKDTLRGGDGSDSILARDGEADTVDCGAGEDSVVADALDVVAGNCEKVDRSPVQPGGGNNGGGNTGGGNGGGGSGAGPGMSPAPAPTCTVPKLTGFGLKADRRKLKRSGCVLGKVTGKKTKAAKVKGQSRRPGTVVAAGAKVNVKLG
jgi:Ca2+-binding RTX toxin-like protein